MRHRQGSRTIVASMWSTASADHQCCQHWEPPRSALGRTRTVSAQQRSPAANSTSQATITTKCQTKQQRHSIFSRSAQKVADPNSSPCVPSNGKARSHIGAPASGRYATGAPRPINPRRCCFMKEEPVHSHLHTIDEPKFDPNPGASSKYVLWLFNEADIPARWKLDVVQVAADGMLGRAATGPCAAGGHAVGTIILDPSPPLLFVKLFAVNASHQGAGYGTAFARRLNTLLARRSYGFAGCVNVALHGVDAAFPFWVKAVGMQHFMRSADAYFGVKDLASGRLPSRVQLQEFWGGQCGHGFLVVAQLTEEWEKRVQRAKRRAVATRRA
jgi:hypothetical protein